MATYGWLSAQMRYTVLQEIGYGKMTVVHKAVDDDTGKVLAVKFYNRLPTISEDAKRRAFLREEAEILIIARDGPYILNCGPMRYLDYPLMMVQLPMDYYMNNLADLMDETAKDRGLKRGQIRIPSFYHTVLTQMLEAVAFLHSKHIMHRQITPRSILWNFPSHFILSDFGLARRGITANTDLGGAQQYIAPEISRGQLQTNAIDMWCLGVLSLDILFRLPLPKPDRPLAGLTYTQWCNAMSEIARCYPKPELMMMLEQDPDERASAHNLLQYLRTEPDAMSPDPVEADELLMTKIITLQFSRMQPLAIRTIVAAHKGEFDRRRAGGLPLDNAGMGVHLTLEGGAFSIERSVPRDLADYLVSLGLSEVQIEVQTTMESESAATVVPSDSGGRFTTQDALKMQAALANFAMDSPDAQRRLPRSPSPPQRELPPHLQRLKEVHNARVKAKEKLSVVKPRMTEEEMRQELASTLLAMMEPGSSAAKGTSTAIEDLLAAEEAQEAAATGPSKAARKRQKKKAQQKASSISSSTTPLESESQEEAVSSTTESQSTEQQEMPEASSSEKGQQEASTRASARSRETGESPSSTMKSRAKESLKQGEQPTSEMWTTVGSAKSRGAAVSGSSTTRSQTTGSPSKAEQAASMRGSTKSRGTAKSAGWSFGSSLRSEGASPEQEETLLSAEAKAPSAANTTKTTRKQGSKPTREEAEAIYAAKQRQAQPAQEAEVRTPQAVSAEQPRSIQRQDRPPKTIREEKAESDQSAVEVSRATKEKTKEKAKEKKTRPAQGAESETRQAAVAERPQSVQRQARPLQTAPEQKADSVQREGRPSQVTSSLRVTRARRASSAGPAISSTRATSIPRVTGLPQDSPPQAAIAPEAAKQTQSSRRPGPSSSPKGGRTNSPEKTSDAAGAPIRKLSADASAWTPTARSKDVFQGDSPRPVNIQGVPVPSPPPPPPPPPPVPPGGTQGNSPPRQAEHYSQSPYSHPTGQGSPLQAQAVHYPYSPYFLPGDQGVPTQAQTTLYSPSPYEQPGAQSYLPHGQAGQQPSMRLPNQGAQVFPAHGQARQQPIMMQPNPGVPGYLPQGQGGQYPPMTLQNPMAQGYTPQAQVGQYPVMALQNRMAQSYSSHDQAGQQPPLPYANQGAQFHPSQGHVGQYPPLSLTNTGTQGHPSQNFVGRYPPPPHHPPGNQGYMGQQQVNQTNQIQSGQPSFPQQVVQAYFNQYQISQLSQGQAGQPPQGQAQYDLAGQPGLPLPPPVVRDSAHTQRVLSMGRPPQAPIQARGLQQGTQARPMRSRREDAYQQHLHGRQQNRGRNSSNPQGQGQTGPPPPHHQPRDATSTSSQGRVQTTSSQAPQAANPQGRAQIAPPPASRQREASAPQGRSQTAPRPPATQPPTTATAQGWTQPAQTATSSLSSTTTSFPLQAPTTTTTATATRPGPPPPPQTQDASTQHSPPHHHSPPQTQDVATQHPAPPAPATAAAEPKPRVPTRRGEAMEVVRSPPREERERGHRPVPQRPGPGPGGVGAGRAVVVGGRGSGDVAGSAVIASGSAAFRTRARQT